MKWKLLALLAVLVLAPALRAADVKAEPGRDIEICFVLDTTGSMSGLIEGAKQKIWAITNEVIQIKPKPPSIRIALVGYRDKGDEYVTRVHDLTDDIDLVFKNLQAFSAGGGGDEPESVNQALNEAVDKINWSPHQKVLKIIFLVGDAPPHMDYAEDVKYPDVCQKAVKKDIIINTVQCGAITSTTPIWQEIARRGEGSFIQLGQTGDMVAIATPVDKELAELNKEIGTTAVTFAGHGTYSGGLVVVAGAKVAAAESAPASVAADRASVNLRMNKVIQGDDELIAALENKLTTLKDLKDEQLPEDWRKLTPEQREAKAKELMDKRAEIRKKIADLVTKRDAYIAEEKKKLAATRPADAFDEQVGKIVRDQAERKK